MNDDVITIAMRDAEMKIIKAQKEIDAKDAEIERLQEKLNDAEHVIKVANDFSAKQTGAAATALDGALTEYNLKWTS